MYNKDTACYERCLQEVDKNEVGRSLHPKDSLAYLVRNCRRCDLTDCHNLLVASSQREDRNDPIVYPGGGAVHKTGMLGHSFGFPFGGKMSAFIP